MFGRKETLQSNDLCTLSRICRRLISFSNKLSYGVNLLNIKWNGSINCFEYFEHLSLNVGVDVNVHNKLHLEHNVAFDFGFDVQFSRQI